MEKGVLPRVRGSAGTNHPHQNLVSCALPQSPQGLAKALTNGAQGLARKLSSSWSSSYL